MSKKYIWTGNKCRDYWTTVYKSSRRLRGYVTGRIGHWGGREVKYTAVSYRRTAIHGLSATEAALIMKGVGLRRYKEYHVRERPDGLVDLFHIKVVHKSETVEIIEV